MAHVQTKNSRLWHPESTHEKMSSQRMFIDNIEIQEENYTDLIGRIHRQVDSITELRTLDVASQDTTIKPGTVVMVFGVGLFYYNNISNEPEDGKEIVAPNIGSGRWVLSSGGGNLIADDNGEEDVDVSDSSITLKIKRLFDKKLKSYFYPLTTFKAVKDPSSKKSLADLLIVGEKANDVVQDVPTIDADILGGRYTADAIDEKFNTYERNFTVGVDTIYNACATAGSTPTSKEPADIANTILKLGNQQPVTLQSLQWNGTYKASGWFTFQSLKKYKKLTIGSVSKSYGDDVTMKFQVKGIMNDNYDTSTVLYTTTEEVSNIEVNVEGYDRIALSMEVSVYPIPSYTKTVDGTIFNILLS